MAVNEGFCDFDWEAPEDEDTHFCRLFHPHDGVHVCACGAVYLRRKE